MNSLSGKVAIVTGASSGIGRATAKLFAHAGAKVVVGARRGEELDRLVDDITAEGGVAVAHAGDVKQEGYAETLVETAITDFGGLDIAFNNAGTLGEMNAAEEISRSGWQETLDTNLTSAFLAAKAQIPVMRRRGGGSLIFTSSFVGQTVGMPGMAAYAASKAGLIGLMQVLAVELGAENIRSNALLPGGTDTEMGRAVADAPEKVTFVQGLHALKRLATPEEIAQTALFLASDASSFMTGSSLFVDGGISITRT